jgi:hypothetical protein
MFTVCGIKSGVAYVVKHGLLRRQRAASSRQKFDGGITRYSQFTDEVRITFSNKCLFLSLAGIILMESSMETTHRAYSYTKRR